MKIISKFKDYYDYVAGKYGGGDPLVRYERKDLLNNEYEVKGRLPFKYSYKLTLKTDEPAFPLLIVMNNAYPIVNDKVYVFDDEDTNRKLFQNAHITYSETFNLSKNKEVRYQQKLEILKNRFKNKTTGFCKAVGQPVFLLGHSENIGSRNYFSVFNKIPNLGELGFASIIPPEQLYQELAFFIGNILKTTEPIIEVSNKDKILQAGFDLKTSFRGK